MAPNTNDSTNVVDVVVKTTQGSQITANSERTRCMPSLITKKRDGKPLTGPEVEFFVRQVVSGQIQDAQLGRRRKYLAHGYRRT